MVPKCFNGLRTYRPSGDRPARNRIMTRLPPTFRMSTKLLHLATEQLSVLSKSNATDSQICTPFHATESLIVSKTTGIGSSLK